MRATGRLAVAVALAMLATATAGAATIAQKGTLRIAVDAGLSPQLLPREGTAPISVRVGGEISTTDETVPPRLQALRVELNREGHLEHAGLAVCPYAKIQPASTSRALAGCRPALVGKGSFSAQITLAGQQAYPVKGRLVLFNGKQGDKPVLYGHIYSARPFATSFVIVFSLAKHRAGTYGTVLTAELPKAMEAWGRLTGLEMTLSRRYRAGGEQRSYLSAGCPAPKGFTAAVFPLARTSFAFEGGESVSSVIASNCKTRG